MTSPKVLAVAAVGLMIVAVFGLILEGPRSAIYPAATAIACGLALYLQTRYPDTVKQWTRRRIIDTTVVVVLAVAVIGGGWLLAGREHSYWTLPVTMLTVVIVTVPFAIAGLVKDARRGEHAAEHAPNERDHGAGPAT
jgi:hypothetical protein